MKRILYILPIAFLAFAGSAHAAVIPLAPGVSCPGYLDHPVYNQDSTAIINCISDVDWKSAVANQTEIIDGKILPFLAPGQTTTDIHGVSDTCYIALNQGCRDSFHTEGHNAEMTSLAKQLISLGFSGQFPRYLEWINAVK